jgi:hypothetical protein
MNVDYGCERILTGPGEFQFLISAAKAASRTRQ